ncbi:tyrosine-type recombinase/integrase [Rhodovulum sp. YNF3179]|uniref:tyrosine-type recombinase/integrase n=1 Tax=Rhodovulum sp. YNF3179 TaxID=3425127 RepID=UPI003D3447E8
MQVKHLPSGKYPDGAGLWLVKRNDGGGQWIQRVTIHGRRREMGLGSIRDVSLKEARELSEEARALARRGKDPIKVRQARRREAARAQNTLRDVAIACFEARKATLKNEGKATRWMGPLNNHVLPKLGGVPVTELDQNDVKNTLAPVWHKKPVVARTALERLGMVMQYAAAMGLDVDMQLTAKAKALLGRQRHKVQHTPAMAWQDVPAFFASLDQCSPAHLALRFLILTAVRSTEARLFNFAELQGNIWSIPGDRMKGGKEHRVPLSDEALQILEDARAFENDGFPFIGNKGKPLSDMTLSQLMKRRGLNSRPHGFRSSFRTWCAEMTDTPREVAEAALAHISGGKVERAYRRTDYLDLRRDLMARWADHVTVTH